GVLPARGRSGPARARVRARAPPAGRGRRRRDAPAGRRPRGAPVRGERASRACGGRRVLHALRRAPRGALGPARPGPPRGAPPPPPPRPAGPPPPPPRGGGPLGGAPPPPPPGRERSPLGAGGGARLDRLPAAEAEHVRALLLSEAEHAGLTEIAARTG